MMRRPRRSTLFPTTTLSRSLVHVFQLSLGAEASSRYPRLRHADFPLWWTEGLAEYFSTGERSEEHTSELQSQSNLVCRLLLEKKKKQFRPTTSWDFH